MKRKNLKGYVRLDSNQRPIGASLIARAKKPYGRFKQMLDPYATDICCPPTSSGIDCAKLGTWASNTIGELPNLFFSGRVSLTDSNCNIYKFAGSTTGYPDPQFFLFLQKSDAAGTVLWQKSYSYFLDDVLQYPQAHSMAIGPDNYVYLLGLNFVIKVDPDGAVVWNKSFNYSTSFNNGTVGIEVTSFNRLYIARWDNISSSSYYVTSIYELDVNTGAELNSKNYTFTTSLSTEFEAYSNYAFGCDKQGNLFIAASAYPGALQKEITVLFKIDPDLNTLWVKAFDPYNSNWSAPYLTSEITDIRTDANDNIIVTMPLTPNVVKVSSDGSSILWQHQIGTALNPNQGDNGRLANSSVNNNDGSVFTVGIMTDLPTTEGNPSRIDMIIKWKSDGTFEFATGFYQVAPFPNVFEFWQFTAWSKYSEAKNNTLLIQETNGVLMNNWKLPTATAVLPDTYNGVVFFDASSYLQIGSTDFSLKEATPVELPAPALVDNGWVITETPFTLATTLTPIL